ncbi:MAG: hypothetical protein AB7J28_08145 [Hyphomonadaceae bacterium]
MFWLVMLGVLAILVLLTLVGAMMVRRNPDTAWEKDEDRPMLGGHDF